MTQTATMTTDEQVARVKELLGQADKEGHGSVLIFFTRDGNIKSLSNNIGYDEMTDKKGRGWWTGVDLLEKKLPQDAVVIIERADYGILLDLLDKKFGKLGQGWTSNPSDSDLAAFITAARERLEKRQ